MTGYDNYVIWYDYDMIRYDNDVIWYDGVIWYDIW